MESKNIFENHNVSLFHLNAVDQNLRIFQWSTHCKKQAFSRQYSFTVLVNHCKCHQHFKQAHKKFNIYVL